MCELNSLLSLKIVWTNVGDSMLRYLFKNMNLSIAKLYLMVAFKIHVFDVSLFEETPNRSNLIIDISWESFLSRMLSKSVILSSK